MARLSKEQWAEARAWWEGDASVSFQMIADKYGCSRPAVGQKAEKDGWARGEASAPEPAATPKEAKVAKVSPSPSKVSGRSRTKQDEGPPVLPPERLSATDWQLITGKRGRGRPTDYREEYVDEIIAYFDIQVQSLVDVEYAKEDGSMGVRKQVVTNTFPTLSRFASKLGVTRDTLYEWAHGRNADGTLKHPDFSYAYARAKDLQDALLTEGGMMGVYEGRFATLAAKNIIGWKDQVETKNEVALTSTSTDELDQIYVEKMAEVERKKQEVIARNALKLSNNG